MSFKGFRAVFVGLGLVLLMAAPFSARADLPECDIALFNTADRELAAGFFDALSIAPRRQFEKLAPQLASQFTSLWRIGRTARSESVQRVVQRFVEMNSHDALIFELFDGLQAIAEEDPGFLAPEQGVYRGSIFHKIVEILERSQAGRRYMNGDTGWKQAYSKLNLGF